MFVHGTGGRPTFVHGTGGRPVFVHGTGGRPTFVHGTGGRPTFVHGTGGRPVFVHGTGGRPTFVHGTGGRPTFVHGTGGRPTFVHGTGGRPVFVHVVLDISVTTAGKLSSSGVTLAVPFGPEEFCMSTFQKRFLSLRSKFSLLMMLLDAAHISSQQHAGVCQGQICSHHCAYCHTEIRETCSDQYRAYMSH